MVIYAYQTLLSTILIGRTDAEAETPILWPPDAKNWLIWKDPDTGKDLKVEREGDDRGWDSWMASPTQWTCIWASSGRWWRIGKPGMLQSMGSQRVRHDWVTEHQRQSRTPAYKLRDLHSCFSFATNMLCNFKHVDSLRVNFLLCEMRKKVSKSLSSSAILWVLT